MERGSVWRDGRMGCEAKLTSETEIKLVRYNAVRYMKNTSVSLRK